MISSKAFRSSACPSDDRRGPTKKEPLRRTGTEEQAAVMRRPQIRIQLVRRSVRGEGHEGGKWST
eukprot:9483631-Prorocentrum_lima.AAC.1